MQIVCDNCGYAINRDRYIKGILVEEYENTYGTHCPSCGWYIPPMSEPEFVKEEKLKKMLLIEQARDRLRKLFRRKRNGNNREVETD